MGRILVQDANGDWVPNEPISADLVAAATTDQVVAKKSDGTLYLKTVSGGGGGGLTYPDDPPASGNTEDDEFDSSTLDAKWTETLSGVTKNIDTDIPSHYVAKVSGGSSDQFILRQSYAPGGDFSATMAVSVVLTSNSQSLDLYAADDTSFTNGFSARISADGVNMTRRTSASTTKGTVLGRITTRNYVHIQRVGTTITVWWSGDGRGWIRVDTQTKTFTMNYLILDLFNSVVTAPHQVAIDWVRRDWITL